MNVYEGIKKDYTRENVTAEKFLAVLTGNTDIAKGKVLNTTKNDTIFAYFSDHGGTELICFPTGPPLYALDLANAFQIMKEKQMFAKFVFYLESCESGSMFLTLANNESIYVTTASKPDEFSYAYYCPPDDYVSGIPLNTCLGDEYSIHFLEDDDQQTSLNETLEQQFLRIKKQTTNSHVMQYGDLRLIRNPLSEFLGNEETTATNLIVNKETDVKSAISSYDVPVHLAYYRYLRATDPLIKSTYLRPRLIKKLQAQQEIEFLFERFTASMNNIQAFYNTPLPDPCGKCCQTLFQIFYIFCDKDDYARKYGYVFKNLCQTQKDDFYIYRRLVDFCNENQRIRPVSDFLTGR